MEFQDHLSSAEQSGYSASSVPSPEMLQHQEFLDAQHTGQKLLSVVIERDCHLDSVERDIHIIKKVEYRHAPFTSWKEIQAFGIDFEALSNQEYIKKVKTAHDARKASLQLSIIVAAQVKDRSQKIKRGDIKDDSQDSIIRLLEAVSGGEALIKTYLEQYTNDIAATIWKLTHPGEEPPQQKKKRIFSRNEGKLEETRQWLNAHVFGSYEILQEVVTSLKNNPVTSSTRFVSSRR